MTVLPPPTPEDVAVLTSDALHIYGWDLSADGNVVKIGIGPFGDDDKPLLAGLSFRAVVVEGETVPLILNRERYAAEVTSIVEWLVMALAHAPREDYPIHYALLRGSLLELADGFADQGEAETR